MTSLEGAWDLVRARRMPAQLVVLLDGEPVLDRAMGCARDDLFWLFSAGKPYLAVLVRRLVQDGLLDLDRPVAAYWPEFGAHGKEAVTVRDVLRHRSGVSTAGNPFLDAAFMPQWDWSLQRLVKARPRHLEPGRTAYGFVSFGFILGEVVQRVTGEPLPAVMRRLVLEPLQVRDTFLGLPPDQVARAVMLHPTDLRFAAPSAFCNHPHVRAAVIPAAGVSATARTAAGRPSMARCTAVLPASARAASAALRPGSVGMRCPVMKLSVPTRTVWPPMWAMTPWPGTASK